MDVNSCNNFMPYFLLLRVIEFRIVAINCLSTSLTPVF